ncbi:hypothetical protein BFF78_38930 [Streptomyces fodineus]|uniref:CHAT domain-containing protein n=1 Tax=Streptomyces fodineus TaxID=1904616 RepID=A0A1D7YKV4_9ACTN|nr:CHAT domain-containing protein [Streptomyces fodineus]AOR36238.1 hypothetical protein BFF78_38930 [Streptomyces fodineus]
MAQDTVKTPVEAVLRLVGAADSAQPAVVKLTVDGRPVASAALGDLGHTEDLMKVFDRGVGEQDREQVGERLYAALLGGELAEEWAALRIGCGGRPPLRVRLDIQSPGLRCLPWELLRHRGQWLWRRPELRWRRGAENTEAPGEPCELGPLRVLVVVCHAAQDDRLLAEQEIAAISGALEAVPGRTHLEVLDHPGDAAELSDHIDQLRPHVVHVIGHGMPRPGTGSPVIVFTTAAGEGAGDWELAPDDVADLTDWKPPLVVLNACHLGKADPADWIGGMAQAFLDAGTRAVVSMQDDIESDAAVVFSEKFYAELCRVPGVDEAVAAARTALAKRAPGQGSWALPVLLTRTAPEQVVPIERRVPPGNSVDELGTRKQYVELGRFVGRPEERRRAWWALDDPSLAPRGTDRPVLVIGGKSQTDGERTGKTWLTNWCLVTWFLRGHHIVSVDLRQPLQPPAHHRTAGRPTRHKDWLSTLRLIRQEATSPRQLCRLPEAAFGTFNAVLNCFAGSGVLRDDPEPEEDRWQPFDDDIGDPNDKRKDRIMAAFLDALRTAAAGRPMVVALDHADAIMRGAFVDVLYRGLVEPIAYGRAAPLRLILVARDAWLSEALPEADSHMLGRVSVGDFRSEQFLRLARAYARRLGVPADDRTVAFLESYRALMAPHFGVETFDTLTRLIPGWRAAGAQGAIR